MADRKNIIVGAARLWVVPTGVDLDPLTVTGANFAAVSAAVDTAIDTAATAALSTAAADTYDVGYTAEGIEVSYEPDFGEIEVDQFLGPARLFKQNMNLTVNTTLAEATLENLLIVWGLEGEDDADEFVISAGELGEAPTEKQLVFLGPGPTGKARLYHIRFAVQTESSSHALRKTEGTMFPVSFRCLPDDNGEYGVVRDIAYA